MGTHRGHRRSPRRGRSTPQRHGLLRLLPAGPAVVGVATLAVAFGGAAMSSTGASQQATQPAPTSTVGAATALGGTDGSAVADLGARGQTVSRDSSRDALDDTADARLVAAAEQQARERNAALAQFAQQAEAEAEKIALDQWVLPLESYRLTATFGEVGLWASTHTGLDFAAPSGTPILSVANGTVTSTGYEGSYGNQTIVTLDDGTELWYCHQTTIDVNPGDTVSAGQTIGTVGSTGNTTGPHLHLEVRPGGGDPVDPDAALRFHGLVP